MDDTNETKFFTNVTLNGETLAVKDKNALTEHQDLSAYAKTADVNNGLAKKQDTIADLDTIRTNATAGAGKQDKLNAGDGIAIDGTTIKAVKIEYIADSTTLKITTPTGGAKQKQQGHWDFPDDGTGISYDDGGDTAL